MNTFYSFVEDASETNQEPKKALFAPDLTSGDKGIVLRLNWHHRGTVLELGIGSGAREIRVPFKIPHRAEGGQFHYWKQPVYRNNAHCLHISSTSQFGYAWHKGRTMFEYEGITPPNFKELSR